MLLSESLTLAEVAKLLPHRPNASTIWRWCRKGVCGVKLPYLKAGRRILIDPSDLERFCQRLAEADRARDECQGRGTPEKPRGRTESQRQADIERAERRLKQAGVI